jgi:hypothetical protein
MRAAAAETAKRTMLEMATMFAVLLVLGGED